MNLNLITFCFLYLITLVKNGSFKSLHFKSIQNNLNKRDTLTQIVFKIKNSNKRHSILENLLQTNTNLTTEPINTSTKHYLKDYLNSDLDVDMSKPIAFVQPLNTCTIKPVTISFVIRDIGKVACGRVYLNTTSCSGSCKSSEKLIANTRLKKSICSACKAIKYTYEKYTVQCVDSSIQTIKVKHVKECSCVALSDTISNVAK